MSDSSLQDRVPTALDRRRRTPRILKVEYNGTSEMKVTFKDRMDTTKTLAVCRLFTNATGVVQFTNFSWTSEFVLRSTTGANVTSYSGVSHATYMSGDIRNKRRFEVKNLTRADRLEVIAGGDTIYDGGDGSTGSFADELDGGDASTASFAGEADGGTS